MGFLLLQIIPTMKDIVAGFLTNMGRQVENVESVVIHGLKNLGITKLREGDMQRVQLHNGTNLVKLFLLPSR